MKPCQLAVPLAVVLALPLVCFGVPMYSENFEVDPTANWTVNNGPSDEAHDFFFDYSTIGIPPAPNSAPGDRNRGLKLQANLANGIFGGMSVSPTGESFPEANVRIKFDWWANFNGGFPAGGSGSTNLSTFGLGTSGAVAQWPGGTIDSIFFGATGDGGASQDWRAYSPSSGGLYSLASGVYAAGTGTTPDARNHDHPYYANFGQNTAPAAQLGLFPQQTGTTLVGSAGMEWHEVEIVKTGSTVTWTVGGTLIATVPLADDTSNTGDNIFFGHSDINAGSSTDANDAALLFTLIDNVQVIPEPGAVLLCLLASLGMLGLRRRS